MVLGGRESKQHCVLGAPRAPAYSAVRAAAADAQHAWLSLEQPKVPACKLGPVACRYHVAATLQCHANCSLWTCPHDSAQRQVCDTSRL